MHDPMIVAFTIRNPFIKRGSYRPSIITVWHVDPETDGTDDSCDWFGRYLSDREREAAWDIITNEIDNMCVYLKGMDRRDSESILTAQWLRARRFYKRRPWYKHPRWHIHHWQFQVHPIQKLKRWLWTRCERCGKRFPYGYAPISYNYTPGGWFKGERGLFHHDCHYAGYALLRCGS